MYTTEQVAVSTTRDCNPGTIFQSRDFGIEKRQSRDPGISPGIGRSPDPGITGSRRWEIVSKTI